MSHCPADAVVLDLIDRVWNCGHLEVLTELYADAFEHDGHRGTVAELREWHAAERRTWAGTAYEVLDCVCDGTAVAVRWRSSGTLVGDWGPVTGGGQRVEGAGAHFFTVEAGRITSVRATVDVFGKAVQLGVRFLPPEPAASAE